VNRLITPTGEIPISSSLSWQNLLQTPTGLSPYFAAQLVDHLYDEDAALVPVKSWLERIYRKP